MSSADHTAQNPRFLPGFLTYAKVATVIFAVLYVLIIGTISLSSNSDGGFRRDSLRDLQKHTRTLAVANNYPPLVKVVEILQNNGMAAVIGTRQATTAVSAVVVNGNRSVLHFYSNEGAGLVSLTLRPHQKPLTTQPRTKNFVDYLLQTWPIGAGVLAFLLLVGAAFRYLECQPVPSSDASELE